MATATVEPDLIPQRGETLLSRRDILLAGILLLVAHLPFLVAHAHVLWLRPHYQFFPLALLGAVALAFGRLQGTGTLTPGAAAGTLALLGLDWLLLALAVVLDSSWLGSVAFLIVLVAVAYGLGGRELLGRLTPALVLLALLIPPPLELDRSLILALQTLTARWSSRILDLLGIYHVMSGHVVEVAGRRLLVEEACSGVNSLFSILACTLFFIFFYRIPALRASLLVVAAVAWVLTLNVCRVVLQTYLVVRWNIDLTTGWLHEALGLTLFALGLALIWSTNVLLLFLLAPGTNTHPTSTLPAAPTQGAEAPIARRQWGHAWPIAVGIAYGLLALGYLALNRISPAAEVVATGRDPRFDTLDADTLPAQVGPFVRRKEQGFSILPPRNPGSEFGELSRVWTYQVGRAEATFSLDYPFPFWHDLTRCYTGQGWELSSQSVRAIEGDGDGDGSDFVEVGLSKPAYRSGTLLYAQFDRQGHLLEARPGGALLSIYRHGRSFRSIWDRLTGKEAAPDISFQGPVFQAQLLIESYQPLTEEEHKEARRFFLRGLEQLRQRFQVP